MELINITKAARRSLLALILACSAGSIAFSASQYTLSGEQDNEPAAWKIVAPTFEEGEEAPDIGKMLWKLKKAGVNAVDEKGNTPLILAARLGDTRRVKSLIEQGAEVNAANETGTTPLMNASFFEKSGECARLLLDAGAEINVEDIYGWTPLMFALLSDKRASFINDLLERGAYAETRSKAGVSPMMVACRFSSDVKIIELLYNAAAEVALADKKGNLPMHYAAQNSTGSAPAFINALVRYRAKPDAKNRDGWTPLMFATHLCESTESAETLIGLGAQVNARKRDGMTPLMLAACNVNPIAIDMMKLLLASGADIEIRDNYGRRLRETAIRSGHSAEVLRFIDGILFDSSIRSYARTSSMAQHAGNIRNLARDAAAFRRLKKISPAGGTTQEEEAAEEILSSAEPTVASEASSKTANSDGNETSDGEAATEPEVAAIASDSADILPADADADGLASEAVPAAEELVSSKSQAASEGGIALKEENEAAEGILDSAVQSVAEETPSRLVNSAENGSASNETTTGQEAAITSADSTNALPAGTEAEAEAEAKPEEPETTASSDAPETGTNEDKNDDDEEEEEIVRSPVKYVLMIEPSPEAQAAALGASAAIDSVTSLVDEIGIEAEFENKAAGTPLVPKDFKMRKARSGKESAAIALHTAASGSRLISDPAFAETQIRANEKMRRGRKARAIAKTRAARKADKLFVTPLMLAATNENDEVAEIIAYLLEQGEDLEAKDAEGRTALACAVRYNARPLAAMALIEAGADLKVKVNGNSLSRLIRFNKRITKQDRNGLLPFLKAK